MFSENISRFIYFSYPIGPFNVLCLKQEIIYYQEIHTHNQKNSKYIILKQIIIAYYNLFSQVNITLFINYK